MQTVVETINSYSKRLKVEISSEDLSPIQQKVLKNFQKSVTIPGFRPGKAPLNMVHQRYKESIEQDIVDEALRKFYSEALIKANVKPVAQGKITDFKFQDVESGMELEIEVEIEPTVELKKYKGLKVEKNIIEVTDEMIDESLEHMREQFATVKEMDEAKKDHFVHFSAQELDNAGVPIVGHKYDNLQSQLGAGKFDPEIESQLIGIKKNEKRVVHKEILPSDGNKENQSQISMLEIHALKIEEKEFPELNDEFVKNLNDENLENLAQLRQRIHDNMKMDLEHRGEHTFQNRLIDELLKENPSEVPPSMVDNYLNEMIKDIKKQSQDKNVDEESMRKEYKASAIHNLRWYFLKKKLIEVENISVSDEEVLKIIDESHLEKKEKNEAKKNKHYLEHLKEDIIEKKVIDLLKEHAEITEVYPFQQKRKVEESGNEKKQT